MNDNKNQLDCIKTIFSHNYSLIQLADTKANILMGINSILIPVIFGVIKFRILSYKYKDFFLPLYTLLYSKYYQ